MSDIKRLHTGDRMSQAVIHGGIVYLAGQVGAPGESAAAQTTAILAKVDALLAEAGTDKSRLIRGEIWLTDMSDFGEMNAIWDAWVPKGAAPARACGSADLATPDYRVEIIITAALP